MRRPVRIKVQPDGTACGATSLHALYRFLGDTIPLKMVLHEIPRLYHGGTLGVYLANHALSRGYQVTIYSYNIKFIDPTWFSLASNQLKTKIQQQSLKKKDLLTRTASAPYKTFLENGGALAHEDLSRALLVKLLREGPVIAGLSATALYWTKREHEEHDGTPPYDDVRGKPQGHFAIISGYTPPHEFHVADPYNDNPYGSCYYTVQESRLMNAILLGVITNDGNLIVIRPKSTVSKP